MVDQKVVLSNRSESVQPDFFEVSRIGSIHTNRNNLYTGDS